MWLYIGYGTLTGAAVGVVLTLIYALCVAWRVYRLQYAVAGHNATREDIQFAFLLEGVFRYFRTEPVRAVWTLYGIPILACATVGFLVENLARIF